MSRRSLRKAEVEQEFRLQLLQPVMAQLEAGAQALTPAQPQVRTQVHLEQAEPDHQYRVQARLRASLQARQQPVLHEQRRPEALPSAQAALKRLGQPAALLVVRFPWPAPAVFAQPAAAQ